MENKSFKLWETLNPYISSNSDTQRHGSKMSWTSGISPGRNTKSWAFCLIGIYITHANNLAQMNLLALKNRVHFRHMNTKIVYVFMHGWVVVYILNIIN